MDILRNKKTSTILLTSVLLPLVLASPAYAGESGSNEIDASQLVINGEGQTLDIISETPLTASRDGVTVEALPEPPPAPTPVARAAYSGRPALSGYSNLLDAARAQLGVHQDCTAMVENALRAVGINIGDVGPMGFGNVGTQVSPADAQPGDIMMRGGHVAIYAGNGVAVHGGFGGSTVESSSDSDPYSYAVIVRI